MDATKADQDLPNDQVNSKAVAVFANIRESQKRPLDWQCTKQNLNERGQYLLETGIWSDCTFVVGLPPNIRVNFVP